MSCSTFWRDGGVSSLVILAVMGQALLASGAASVDQLADLTGRATAIPTLKVRDNFANQFDYDVTVRNLTSDSLVADSLVPVVERITELPSMGAAERSVAALPMERSTGLPAWPFLSRRMTAPVCSS